MNIAEEGVLLVDWENLAGAILGRGKIVDRGQVDALWAFANQRCGNQLRHAHMAAARFDPSISAAMREHLIEEEVVRSTKEQADILLTVLAMDYLHAGIDQFILVTGDQDFVPLISRLRRDGRQVTVVSGDRNKLSSELKRVLATPGLDSVDISDVVALRNPPVDEGYRSLLGLLELQRRGLFLGGRETGERTSLLAEWGVIGGPDESQYWSTISALGEQSVRPDAAVPGSGGEWLARTANRTYLRLDSRNLNGIVAVDHALRQISARPTGLTVGALRSGPFINDDGSLLARTLDALQAVGLVRRGADNGYALSGASMQLGYLEPLWRVFAGLSAECYRRSVSSVLYTKLEPLLGRTGIGQGKDSRSAGTISAAVKFARSVGVIDVIAVEKRRHVSTPISALSQMFERGYHQLYRSLEGQREVAVAEVELLNLMEQLDAGKSMPQFGYDRRDRHRFLRILSQCQLATWRDGHVLLHNSPWGAAGLPSSLR